MKKSPMKQTLQASTIGKHIAHRWLLLRKQSPWSTPRGWVDLRDERGDVPGWVLVTVMTAGLVTAIWVLADTQLKAVLEHAMATLGAK